MIFKIAPIIEAATDIINEDMIKLEYFIEFILVKIIKN
jgi:hypothetical protein